MGTEIPEDLKKPPFIKRMLVVVNKMDEVKDEEDYQVFLELSEIKFRASASQSARGETFQHLQRRSTAFSRSSGFLPVRREKPTTLPLRLCYRETANSKILLRKFTKTSRKS